MFILYEENLSQQRRTGIDIKKSIIQMIVQSVFPHFPMCPVLFGGYIKHSLLAAALGFSICPSILAAETFSKARTVIFTQYIPQVVAPVTEVAYKMLNEWERVNDVSYGYPNIQEETAVLYK